MRITVLYRSNTEYERSIIDFVREFKRRTGRNLDMLDVNTREGSSMATLYDVLMYPSILAVSLDGHVHQMWQGQDLPLLDEVEYYAMQPEV